MKKYGLFKKGVVCVKTLYNYIDQVLLSLKNLDLALKVAINTKKTRIHKNKKVLGKSITKRPLEIELREEVGHWEIDTVIGKKSGDEALLTITERKTRTNLVFKISAKDDKSVQETISTLKTKLGSRFSGVFKTITSDNGSEFSSLVDALDNTTTEDYFSRPCSAFERGYRDERHNGLIRRFIPKGKPITSVSNKTVKYVTEWCNNLPRKILGYRTPMECFIEEISLLGQT